MNKKEFYEAPQWGKYELRLNRAVLTLSDGVDENGTETSEISDPYGG